MGGLRLYAFEKHNGNNVGKSVKIWEKLGNQKNTWHNARITYKPRSNVQVYVTLYFIKAKCLRLVYLVIANHDCCTCRMFSFTGRPTFISICLILLLMTL